MVSFGVLLVVVGIGSFALPAAGIQSRIFDSLDPAQPWLGIVVAAVGLITVLFGQRRLASVQTQTTVVEEAPPISRSEVDEAPAISRSEVDESPPTDRSEA